jgi:hypothetical protein
MPIDEPFLDYRHIHETLPPKFVLLLNHLTKTRGFLPKKLSLEDEMLQD